jgi:hypothetical protein
MLNKINFLFDLYEFMNNIIFNLLLFEFFTFNNMYICAYFHLLIKPLGFD